MTITFPDVTALSADVLAARPGIDSETGEETIDIALQAEGEDPQVFAFPICARTTCVTCSMPRSRRRSPGREAKTMVIST